MVCEVMDVHPVLKDDREEPIQVEELRQRLDHLISRNQELEQLVQRLRQENAELLCKANNGGSMEGTPGAPPPPPPPPPPPGLLAPPVTHIIKQRRSSSSKKSLDEGKQDEAGSKQSQLIMEVVNFLKSGGFGKSKRQRSMTQPDLSQDLAKFKESRGKDTKEVAADKFKSLKRRTDKAECLAKELDALKTSYKENVSPKDSPSSTPSQSRRGSHSKLKHGRSTTGASWAHNEPPTRFNAQPVPTMKKSGSVADIRFRLESASKDGSEAGSRVPSKSGTPMTSHGGSPSETPRTSRKNSLHQSYAIGKHTKDDSRTKANDVEEQEAHITFENEQSLQNPNTNVRTSSRSSGIASSLLSERLSELSFNSETDHQEDEGCPQGTSTSASPRIIVTLVDDPIGNPLDAALKAKASSNESEIDGSQDGRRHERKKTGQELTVIVPSLKESENLVTVNGSRLRAPATVQLQGTLSHSTKDKQRFWEDALAVGSGAPNSRSGTKDASSSGSQSPTLEKFQTAARMTIKNKNQVKPSSSRGHPSSGRQTASSSLTGAVKSNHSLVSPAGSTSFNAPLSSTGISRRAAANMNKFRT